MIFQCETFWQEKQNKTRIRVVAKDHWAKSKNQAEQPVLDIKFDDFCFFFAKIITDNYHLRNESYN